MQGRLFALIRARVLDDELTAMLRDFVRDGSKVEAVFATRRLDGFRVERMELISDEVRVNADRAWGQVFYWVRTEVD